MDIYTCKYQYVPVHTSIYYPYLNFAFFDIRHHPIISPAREMHAVAINSLSASWMYVKPSCPVSCTYQYVPVRTGHIFLYWSVPVCTCTYKYILVRTILPDPVQVYRIPDGTMLRTTLNTRHRMFEFVNIVLVTRCNVRHRRLDVRYHDRRFHKMHVVYDVICSKKPTTS